MVARSGYGAVDRNSPEAAGRCDRSGRIFKRRDLVEEMRWAGDRLVPTGFLVHPRYLDVPHPQDRLRRLVPDPRPVSDPRPDIEQLEWLAQVRDPVLAAADRAYVLTSDNDFILVPGSAVDVVSGGRRITEIRVRRITEDGRARALEAPTTLVARLTEDGLPRVTEAGVPVLTEDA